jgi:DNA-binding MarR family transcriptional regulator
MSEINPIIHQPTRLKIVSALVSLEEGTRVDFSYLLNLLSLSEGNLSTHLRVLEKEGLISTSKEFVKRRPKTWIWITDNGRKEFENYVKELEQIFKGNIEEEKE